MDLFIYYPLATVCLVVCGFVWTKHKSSGDRRFGFAFLIIAILLSVAMIISRNTAHTGSGNDTVVQSTATVSVTEAPTTMVVTVQVSVTEAPTAVVVTVQSGTYIREQPNTSSNILGTTKCESEYEYLDQKTNWYKIRYNGTEAWVSASRSELSNLSDYALASSVDTSVSSVDTSVSSDDTSVSNDDTSVSSDDTSVGIETTAAHNPVPTARPTAGNEPHEVGPGEDLLSDDTNADFSAVEESTDNSSESASRPAGNIGIVERETWD